jgi:RHS Repeat
MSDLAKWKVRGPVWTLRKEHAEWDPSQGTWQAPRGVSSVTFRHDGQVSEGEFHNPDGSVARWARVYDNDGRIIEEQFWRDDGPRSTVVYSYDALGRLAARGNVAPDGARRETETFRYDGAGRKTKVTFLSQDQADTPIHYGVEGTEHAYSAPEAVTLTVAYDDRELPTEASFHDANGGLVRRVVFSRDYEGRLLTEVVHFGGESPFRELQPHGDIEQRASKAAALKMAFEDRVFCNISYAYDSKGRLQERTLYIGNLSEELTVFEYDDYDDPIAETSRSRNRRVDIDDDGVVRTTEEEPGVQQHNRYDYQYDSHGNWTERVGSYRIGSQPEFQRSNIERRTITYYEL